jgi:cytidylate kinase
MGSAVWTWWVASQRRSRANRILEGRRDRGTVIFNNAPQASTEGII